MKPTRIVGIIPAAGRSRRFGGQKQLHLVDGKPLLLRVIEALCGAPLASVIVVTRAAIRGPLEAEAPAGVQWVAADDPSTEMIDSIRLGIAAGNVQAGDGVLVCPGDLPRLRSADVALCCEHFAAHPDRLVLASHGGRRGHPLVFPAALCATVASPACDGGLRALLQMHAACIEEVACGSDGVLHDVDTRADLPD